MADNNQNAHHGHHGGANMSEEEQKARIQQEINLLIICPKLNIKSLL